MEGSQISSLFLLPVNLSLAHCQSRCLLLLRSWPSQQMGPATPLAQVSMPCFMPPRPGLLHVAQWEHWREVVQESLPWGTPPAWCLGSLGTPRGCNDNLLLPWHVVRETTCPGLSSHKYTVQMLKMCRDNCLVYTGFAFYLDLPTNILSNGSSLTFLERLFPMTHYCEAFPHMRPPCSPLWPALVYLLFTEPNSFNFTLLLLLLTFLKREIYRDGSGEVAKHPTACPH